MIDHNNNCGTDPDYCQACTRPDSVKDVCREMHRIAEQYTRKAYATNDPLIIAALIELLASMAIDVALSATGDPFKAIHVIRDIVANRLAEVVSKAGSASAPATPPSPLRVVH